jgi:Tol biopolymer transport system component
MKIRNLSLPGVIAMLAVGCSDSAAPAPVPEVPTHDLVFEGYLTSTPELLAYDSSTGQTRRLLSSGVVVMDPEPSPDGSKIAFVVANYVDATGDIFTMNRDGTGLKQLTLDGELDDQPTWSPDGTRIAFRSFRTLAGGHIVTMNADGSNQVDLTPDPLPGTIDHRRPAWSPDGTRIAFSSNEGGGFDIWTMKPDGSDARRISTSSDFESEPAWSPDGSSIAFRRSFSSGGSDLIIVAVASGQERLLALPGEQRLPVWTPDGARLVFVNSATVAARPDIYSMTPDGVDVRPIVTDGVAGGSLNPAFLRRPSN